jgi:hypothetical protein
MTCAGKPYTDERAAEGKHPACTKCKQRCKTADMSTDIGRAISVQTIEKQHTMYRLYSHTA